MLKGKRATDASMFRPAVIDWRFDSKIAFLAATLLILAWWAHAIALAQEPTWSFDPRQGVEPFVLGTPGTQIRMEGGEFTLRSDVSEQHYQLISPDIEVTPGARYSLMWSLKVIDGAVSVGVLDAVANAWIATAPVAAD